jgi:hypothetical protein
VCPAKSLFLLSASFHAVYTNFVSSLACWFGALYGLNLFAALETSSITMSVARAWFTRSLLICLWSPTAPQPHSSLYPTRFSSRNYLMGTLSCFPNAASSRNSTILPGELIGFQKDVPVSLNCRKLPIRTIFNILLRELSHIQDLYITPSSATSSLSLLDFMRRLPNLNCCVYGDSRPVYVRCIVAMGFCMDHVDADF